MGRYVTGGIGLLKGNSYVTVYLKKVMEEDDILKDYIESLGLTYNIKESISILKQEVATFGYVPIDYLENQDCISWMN